MLVSQEGYALDTTTGQINYCGHIKTIELTGTPLMLSRNVLGQLIIHYETHMDCCDTNYHYDSRMSFVSKMVVCNDPTYIGSCFNGFDVCEYHRCGDDLVCGGDRVPDFFKKCKTFLYMTCIEQIADWDDVLTYVAHYVKLDGTVYGRDPQLTKIGDYNILFDVNLCVWADNSSGFIFGGDIFVVPGSRMRGVYDRLCQLPIDFIEIYPDVCRITLKDGTELILDREGLSQDRTLNLTLRPQTPIKRADEPRPGFTRLMMPELARLR